MNKNEINKVMKESNKIVMSNLLVLSDWSSFRLVEFKALMTILSMVNPEWDDFKKLSFDMDEFKERINQKNKNMSTKELHNILSNINKNQITIGKIVWQTDENNNLKYTMEELKTTPLFSEFTLRVENDWINNKSVKTIDVEINEKVKTHLLVSNRTKRDSNGALIRDENNKVIGQVDYSSFSEDIIDKLGSAYAVKLFLNMLGRSNKKAVELSFEQLMDIMGIPKMDKKKLKESKDKKEALKLKKYKNFRSRTLIPIIKLINEETNINVEFSEVIDGENITLIFKSVKKKKSLKKHSQESDDSEENNNEKENSNSEENNNNEDSENQKSKEEPFNNEKNDVDIVLNSFKEIVGHSHSKGDEDIVLALLDNNTVEEIINVIKDRNKIKPVHGMKYIKIALESDRKNKKAEKENKKEIAFKNSNKSGDEMIKALEEQLGGPVDFNKIFN